MSVKLRDAMPVGSKWAVYNHRRAMGLGEVQVMAHGHIGITLHLPSVAGTVTLPYPPDNQWVLDAQGHVRIGNAKGELMATYAPA